MENKRLIIFLAIVVILLLIPLIAMLFTTEVDWDIYDFTIMGILLFGAGSFFELVIIKVKSMKNRILICGAVLFAFFLIWAELAVGIRLGTTS